MNKIYFLSIIGFLFGVVLFSSCDNEVEALAIQKPYTYSDTYYQNLRDYKASDHQISFMWFADYSSTHSMGLHFAGLPDSLDICSLWGGIPSDVKDRPNTFYNKKIYDEMRFCQKVKGTRFTYVTIPNTGNGADPSGDGWKYIMTLPEEERIQSMGDSLLNIINMNDLDGLDLDYEISGCWLHGDNFVKLIEYLGQHIGPQSEHPEKLLMVDGWPINGGYEFLSYFTSQAYQSSGGADLQRRYNEMATKLPSERFIVTENIGDYYANGGTPFTESDGNNKTEDGKQLYSLQGMARWNPSQGKKGGFGAFYGQRDYSSNPPYFHFRRGIQIQNPAVH